MMPTNHSDQLGEIYPTMLNELLHSTFGVSFYRAMHFSAKRGLAIACLPSVCLSVCDVGGL